MYWIFLVLFVIGVLVPDIVRSDIYFLPEERAEEVAIFLLGTIGSVVFIFKEHQLLTEKKAREKERKWLNQTGKDLAESYSYIGEVNRKIDILMGVILGFSSEAILNKKEEREAYNSIIDAANFLMRADVSSLRFVDMKTGNTEKDVMLEGKRVAISNKELIGMKEDETIKKTPENLIIASLSQINDVRAFLVIHNYNKKEEANPKNIEILKVLVSQGLFLYSYVAKHKEKGGR